MATTVYMNLALPVPGSTAGPTYASMLNAALTALDAHDHGPSKGVPVRASGLYVDSALGFGGFDATALRSTRFTSQAAPLSLPTDLSCLYASGGELYYNDGIGNQIQLTSGGALNAASIGGIGGDYATSPGASLFYTSASSLFSHESAAGVKANVAHGPIFLYEPVASGKYARLKVPTGLAANYDLTLPAALPASTKIVTLDNTGAVAAVYDVDGATLEVAANALRVKDGGIVTAKIADLNVTTAKIAALNVTRAKLEAVGQQISGTCGLFTTASLSYVAVTNLSVSITTTGRPVILMLVPNNSGGTEWAPYVRSDTIDGAVSLQLKRGTTAIGGWYYLHHDGDAVSANMAQIDVPAAGTYTYTMNAKVNVGTATIYQYRLVAYEL